MTDTTTAAPPTLCPDWCTLATDDHRLEDDESGWIHEAGFGRIPEHVSRERTKRLGADWSDAPVITILAWENIDEGKPYIDCIFELDAPDRVQSAAEARAIAQALLEAADLVDHHHLQLSP